MDTRSWEFIMPSAELCEHLHIVHCTKADSMSQNSQEFCGFPIGARAVDIQYYRITTALRP